MKRKLLPIAAVALLAATGVAGEPVSQRPRPRQGPAPSQPMTSSTLGQQTSHVMAFTKPYAPTGLTTTTDTQVCTQHGGFGAGLACKALLAQGRLVLVWNYANGPVPAAGFHVYRVDGGARAQVDAQAITPDLKIFIVDPPPPDGYSGACYAVSAYASGGEESDLTPALCANGQMLAQTATFSPTQSRSIGRRSFTGSGMASDDYNTDFNTASATEVGYHYATSKGFGGDVAFNEIFRAALLFDVSSLRGKTIRQARLEMGVDTAFLDPSVGWEDVPSDHRTSCAAKIGVGVARWWSYSDWIEDAIVSQPGEYNGPDISMDVTPIVRDWSTGQPNFGIVLEGEEENLKAFTEKGCVTTYLPASVQLIVEYQ